MYLYYICIYIYIQLNVDIMNYIEYKFADMTQGINIE